MAKIKVGNVELEIPEEVSRYARTASGKSKEQLLKELEETRRKFLALKKALTAEEREEGHEGLDARERKYGYKRGKNAHLKKPKEYEDVPEDEFADPVGYNYPVNNEKRARAALVYFIRYHGAYDDINAKKFIYERILKALRKFGIKRRFDPTWPGDWLVSKELKEWMEGYEKWKDLDTEEMREKAERAWLEGRRLTVKEDAIEKKGKEKSEKKEKDKRLYKALGSGVSHILTLAPQSSKEGELEGVGEEELPSALAEGLDALLAQIAEAATRMLADFIKDTVEETRKLFEDTVKKVAETIAEAVGELAEALTDLVKEIKGEEGIEVPEEGEEGEIPEEGEAAVAPAPAPTPAPGVGGGVGAQPPASPPPTAGEATGTTSLAKQISELISDELVARLTKKEETVNIPYIRATSEYLEAAKQSSLGRAINALADMLTKRFDVEFNEKGDIVLRERKEEK